MKTEEEIREQLTTIKTLLSAVDISTRSGVKRELIGMATALKWVLE